MKLGHLILTGFVATSAGFVHGESLLRNFERVDQTPSYETIIDFLHKHRHEQDLCNSITFRLNIRRTEETSLTDWTTIIDIVSRIITSCEAIDRDSEPALELFGSPFKEWVKMASDKSGIHGSINIGANRAEGSKVLADSDMINLKINMYHETAYDEKTWYLILDSTLTLIEQVELYDKNEDASCIKALGRPLQIIVNAKHIRRDLSITLKDMNHGKLVLGFKDKK